MASIILAFSICFFSLGSLAQLDEPLMEGGIGVGHFFLPLYPGAEETQERQLAIPFFIYRGKVIKADGDDGVRGEIFNLESFKFDMSFAAGFSADSEKSKVRQGMPDLEYMGQLGPRMVMSLYRDTRSSLRLKVPLRAAFFTDFRKLEDRGLVFSPNLSYKYEPFVMSNTKLLVVVGGVWAAERYSSEYYEVSTQYANASRPAFEAQSGFQELYLDLALAFQLNSRWRLFLGGVVSNYSLAKNRESPLLNAENTVSAGVGLVWSFFESQRRAGQVD